MGKQQRVNLDYLFSSAEQAYQLVQAETEIERLKAEIERLRASDAQELETQMGHLRSQLTHQGGMLNIPLSQIQPNPHQPRQTFLSESLQAMAHSLQQEGQLQPVVLMETVEGYILFDGERRWRSAQFLGWESLKAVLIPQPEALHRQALITSLHREDLNPLDKAEAILAEIVQTTQISSETIPRTLSAVIRRLTKQKKLTQLSALVIAPVAQQREELYSLTLNPSEQGILSVLLGLQLNPASIDANIFPMLILYPDLKVAMREQGLKGSQALLLQHLSPKNLQITSEKATTIRQQATIEVIQQQLSVSQTRQLVRELRQRYTTPLENPTTAVRAISTLTQVIEKLAKEQFEMVETQKLERIEQLLREKLGEIAEVLQNRQGDNKET